MNLFKIIILACILNLSSLFAQNITIGATPNPFGNLLELMKDDFKNKGYELKIVEIFRLYFAQSCTRGKRT